MRVAPPTQASYPVMPALVAGIHVLDGDALQNVDGRDKPGHDDELVRA